jgi:CheY-like chemotaxis protein
MSWFRQGVLQVLSKEKMAPFKLYQPNRICHRPCRVLLVEDNSDDQILSCKTLEASESVAEVHCFSNGCELLNYLNSQNTSILPTIPTIIVIDLNMPQMDGFEILKQLKSEPFFNQIPIIVVSGVTSYENVSRALVLRASAFFRKPLSACDINRFLSHGALWPNNIDL